MFSYVLPVFLILVLGAVVRRLPQTPLGLFQAMEWLSFYVAFPALLFVRTAELSIDAQQFKWLALLVLGPMALILLVVVLGLRVAKTFPDPARSSVIQGATRPSTYFGLAISGLVFPADTAALVMLSLALALPPANVIAVVALSWWGGKQVTARSVLRAVALNPIILATAAGASYNLSGLPIAEPVSNALEILGSTAIGLGLLCVGGGLVFELRGAHPIAIVVTSAIKLLALPAITWLACNALGVGPVATAALCFYAALPTAPNAYIMARQMGGDARLMASIITAQTLLCMLTVPLWLTVLGVGQ